MNKDTALRLALEALEMYELETNSEFQRKAITAIKAALEANEFNPDWDTQAVLTEEIQRMAKRIEELEANDKPYALEASMFSNDKVKVDPVTGNVSIGTPQREAKDEPVAYINVEQRKLEWAKYVSWGTPTVVNLPKIPLYTTPPQRTWVGLTDEEMEAAIPFGNLSGEYSYDDILNIILLIQAKLRRKNYD
jgi:hypothetical protein